MPTHFVRFRSPSINQNGEFYIHLPEDELPPFMAGNPNYDRDPITLILLHGFSGDCTDWLYNAPVQEFCMQYNIAIVMPSGSQFFYLDLDSSCRKYASFIGKDLIGYLQKKFNLAKTRETTWIGGLSMGGFGALHTGFQFPETFGSVIALSSALIIHQLKHMTPEMENSMANYDYYVDTFGDLAKAEESDFNPEVLFLKNREKGIQNPAVYMACGTEDFLIKENHIMRDFLKKEKADLFYEEAPGVHDWNFWKPFARKGIEYMLEHNKK